MRVSIGTWLLVVAAAIAVAVSMFDYLWTGNGIHGTPGALLVALSTGAMLVAAAAIALIPGLPRWLRGLLLVLIALDVVGTAFAAYMLEANVLVAATGLAAIGWIARLAIPSGTREAHSHA